MNSMSLKISSEILVKPLTNICNLSLTQGIFPSQLKIANVIPLYKSDDPMLFNDYRPVSVLCVLSKVFEKIMYNRVSTFLEIFKILHENQYGFRKKSSTHLALLSFVDKVIQAIEKGEYAIGVSLDFSKAFDTVDHDILLDLAIITEWLKANKLSLNIKKTHYMCFSAKNKVKPDISLKIDGEIIAEVTSSKFLGVIIDDKLNWKDHVSFVCRKGARGLGVIIKARKVLRNESLKNLCYSFIYPYLIYWNQVWGSACKTNIEPLFILQKKALRIITGVHPRSPSGPLFCQLKFLNCENIFKYLVGRLMYRVYHEELTTLQFLFIKNSDIHMHGTRQRGHYHIPLCRTNLGKSSLRYFGALLWNKVLNADINPNVSDFIFSRNLKTAICNNLL